MASIINAGTSGVTITGSSSAALNIQISGTNAIEVGTDATTTISNATITSLTISNPSTFPAGSASAPAVTTTGDTNTGIYFPAADQVAVTTGGTVAAAFNSNGLFFRNRIINGDMRIDQRNAGAAVTINNGNQTFLVDRWWAQGTGSAGVFTAQQSTTAPSGFTNSLVTTVTTADSTLAAGDLYDLSQIIEGFNVADFAWGTASARPITVSFWVRSSVTGTFGGSIVNSAYDRSYPFTYTINSANTFEYKTITIPGDTSGTWLTNNGVGVRIYFGFGCGSTFSGTAGAWAGAFYLTATGATNLMATLNATWYVTGVQLETGSVATPFERRPYGTEFFLCQRYYQEVGVAAENNFIYQGYAGSGSTYYVPFPLAVPMRAAPTATVAGTWGSGNVTTPFTVNTSNNNYRINITATAAGSFYIQNNGAGSKLTFAIEL